MSAPMLLLGAKVGVDVLGAFSQTNVQQGSFALQQAQSELAQFQVERQGRLIGEQRNRQFASLLGAQRAQIANAGIVGGRTARLLVTESQLTFARQRQEDRRATRFGVAQQQTRQSVLRAQAGALNRQLGINLLGTSIDAGLGAANIRAARAAERG